MLSSRILVGFRRRLEALKFFPATSGRGRLGPLGRNQPSLHVRVQYLFLYMMHARVSTLASLSLIYLWRVF